MKRSLIIILVLALVIGTSIAAYFLFFANKPGLTTGTTTIGGGTLPSSGQTSQNASSTEPTIPTIAGGGAPAETPKAVPVSARLVKIDAGPVVSGEAVTTTPAKNASSSPETIVSFIERASGNVFSYSTLSRAIVRTSNKTIPGVQSATWAPDGSFAVVQYLSGDDLSTVNSYALQASGADGFFLPQNLAGVAVSTAGILTLASGVNNSSASLARLDGSRATTVFTTPLSAIRTSFAGKGQYLAFSKPSATLAGGAFIVGSTGRFSRIAGPHTGLVALASPSGKTIFVSYVNESGTMSTELVTVATGAVTALPLGTIADKCVWTADSSAVYCGVPENAPGALYPDDWYQGAVSFSDRIWKINLDGRYAQMVLDFSAETKSALDAVGLAIDPTGAFLAFVNKNDGSLWGYSL